MTYLFGDCDGCSDDCVPSLVYTSRDWELVVAGITNNSCFNCAKFNGTFTLSLFSGSQSCNWKATPNPPLCLTGEQWNLSFAKNPARFALGLPQWRLANSSMNRFWKLKGAVFDCQGPNVFDFYFGTAPQCSNQPAELTITPLGPYDVCVSSCRTDCTNWPSTLTTTVVSGSTTNCIHCPGGMATVWQLVVAGVTNDTCTACDDYNGTFTFTHSAATCLFPGFTTSGGCGSSTLWNMGYSSIYSNWVIQNNADKGKVWVLRGSHACNGTNIFDLAV